MAEIPSGTVGLVEAEERQRKDEALLQKHTQKSAGSRHLLTEEEDEQLEEKLEKQRLVQEKLKARLAEAEKKDPSLKSKNPHILE